MLRKSVSALLFAFIIAVSLVSFTQSAKAPYYYTWDSATSHTRVNGAPFFWDAKAEADKYGFTRLFTGGGIGFGSVEAWADYYLTVTAQSSSTYVYLTYDAKGYWSDGGKITLQIIDTVTGQTVLDKTKNLPYSPNTVTRDTIGAYTISTVVGRQYRVKVKPYISATSNPFGFGGLRKSDYYYSDRFIKLVVFAFYATGGGCPILSVFDGSNYVTEGLLDIHNPDGIDLVYNHTLTTEPAWTMGKYQLRLVEHQQTHSYIDQVKLYAMLEDGTEIELPLTYAWHSEDGNVLPQLLFSDEWKTDTLGADLNNGTSQSIDLKFASPPNLQAVSFIFQIEGNNRIIKR